MNLHLLALQLMALQGCLGAFDTVYHHELTVALPRQAGARLELAIHAVRALLYAVLFVGLGFWRWDGAWALVLVAVFAIEIGLTLWDFIVEDRTRLLPATERVTHTVLAMNGGAFVALLVLTASDWYRLPTALSWHPNGLLGGFLAVCGLGVALSGLRDGAAAWKMGRAAPDDEKISFSATSEHVLVTGATGFIGQKLVRALCADGHVVTVLTRSPRQAAWRFAGGVRCVGTLDQLPPRTRVDVVINLAGAPILGWRWSPARRAVLRRSRTGLAEQLVTWMAQLQRKPRLFISASAIGFYGVQASGDDRLLDEACPPQAVFMSALCQEWEQAARQAEQHGVAVIRLRLGLVLGKQGALPSMLLPVRLGLGGALGSGRQWVSWIHIDDVVRAVAHLWASKDSGACNLTAPDSVRQQQFSAVAAQVLRRPCRLRTPAWPVRLLLGEQADLLLAGQRVAPGRLAQSGFVFRYPGLQAALSSIEQAAPGP